MKAYAIGIDVGGTNTAFGIVDREGNILSQGKMKTVVADDVETFVDNLYLHLTPLIENSGGIGQIAGIGVGAPDANYFTGVIGHAVNLPWGKSVPLARLIADKFDIPVVLTNDANAAAYGEMTYGVARGMKDFIMITLGTGVGSGIIVNGQVVLGHDGSAGELGHVIVCNENGRPCGCGRNGCLEMYTSARGLAYTARELMERDGAYSLLSSLNIEEITSKDVYEAAVKGDKVALEIFELTGEILGKAFANFVAFSSPQAIVLFGGLAKAGDFILRPIQFHMENNILKNYRGKVDVLFSSLSEADAAVLGSSSLGWDAANWSPRTS